MASTPESSTSTGSGAARYASGIQPWIGKAKHLDQEAAAKKQKILLAAGREQVGAQLGDREAELAGVLGDQDRGRDRADQHQQRADKGVDDHLGRRRDPVTAAEDPDQEEERDQHQVEEEHEQEQVLGEEGAQGRGLAEPEQKVEEAPRKYLLLVMAAQSREAGHPGPQSAVSRTRKTLIPSIARL